MNLPLPSTHPGQRYLRFVLLSTADGDSGYRHQRVDRLYHLSAGSDAAIIWLLDDGGGGSSFAQFQIECVPPLPAASVSNTDAYDERLADESDMPLIPLQSIEDLPATLSRFHRAFLKAELSTRHPRAQASGTGPVQTLLPYCAVLPPLSEHKVHVLSDVTVGLADLANMVNSREGRAEIARYLEQKDADRIIGFWSREYIFDHVYK